MVESKLFAYSSHCALKQCADRAKPESTSRILSDGSRPHNELKAQGSLPLRTFRKACGHDTSSLCLGAATKGGYSDFNRRLNNHCFWYHARNEEQPALSWNASRRIQEELPPGTVRTGYGSIHVFRAQSSLVKKLKEDDWPTIAGRQAWPSSPTITEWLEMLRKGAKSSDFYTEECGHFVRSSVREFNSNIEFAKRIISRQVIGIRADVKVPTKWFGAFRYCRGFLILTAPYLPAGLARFLASIWCTDPYSLWLERKATLKQYLRAVPAAIDNYKARIERRTAMDHHSEASAGSFASSADSGSEFYSENESELD